MDNPNSQQAPKTREELGAMNALALFALAKKVGANIADRTKPALIEAILAVPPQPQSAAVADNPTVASGPDAGGVKITDLATPVFGLPPSADPQTPAGLDMQFSSEAVVIGKQVNPEDAKAAGDAFVGGVADFYGADVYADESTKIEVEDDDADDFESLLQTDVRYVFVTMLAYLWQRIIAALHSPRGAAVQQCADAMLNREEPLDVESTINRWQWASKVLRRSPAVAVDAHGNYSVEVCQDGSIAFTQHAAPNLLNRPTGMVVAGDVTMRIADVPEFLLLLGSAYVQGNEIIEADETAMAEEEDERRWAVEDQDDALGASQKDPTQLRLEAMAEHFGIQPLPGPGLLEALADACGVTREDGEAADVYVARLLDTFDDLKEKALV